MKKFALPETYDPERQHVRTGSARWQCDQEAVDFLGANVTVTPSFRWSISKVVQISTGTEYAMNPASGTVRSLQQTFSVTVTSG